MSVQPDPRAHEMVAAYVDECLTFERVGRRFRVSGETVRRYVIQAGVKPRGRWDQPVRAQPSDEAEPAPTVLAHERHVRAVDTARRGGFPILNLRRAA